MDDTEIDLSGYFSGRAVDYVRFRPSYPAGAIQAALAELSPPVDAVDVGSGTGAAAQTLVAAGARVVAVEPNDEMRAVAARAGLTVQAGSAEATGLPDASCDLVVCAQAFHWFEAEPALREFHRILKPRGRLALLWNVRDDHNGLGVIYAEVVCRARKAMTDAGLVTRNPKSGPPDTGGWFGNLRKLVFENPFHLTWEALVGRASSASYFPPDGPLRDELLSLLRSGFEAHQQDGRVLFPQGTELTLADRLPAGKERGHTS